MANEPVVVFDVNETLSDLGPMAARFQDVGADGRLAKLWFATVLRDGFALTAAGGQDSFSTIAGEALRGVLAGLDLNRGLDDAVEHVLAGFNTLPVHPDVPEGIRALHDAGLRLVTLTNGSTAIAERLLTTAGVRDRFEQLLSVEDAGAWKPAPASYAYAASVCGVRPSQMLLVAVHPWDIDGAARAGLSTAWLNRDGSPYPGYFARPGITATSLPDLAAALAARPGVPRTDRASRVMNADPARVYAALIDPEALTKWLPPSGMSGRFERFDARPGGSYRLVLTYENASANAGKSTSDSDIVEARFVEITPGRRVVQSVDFVSDDPAFAGTMTMVWEASAERDGTRVEFRAEDVPPGISAEDHAVGLNSSLDNLAAYLATTGT